MGMGGWWKRAAAGALVAAFAAGAAAGAFDDLAARDARPEDLTALLGRVAGGLARGSDKVRGKCIVYCSPDRRTLQARGQQIDEMMLSGAEQLAKAGFGGKGAPPEMVVVEVEAHGGFVGALESTDGHSILVRRGAEASEEPASYGKLPELVARPDGPPLARDVVDAAARLRTELWSRGGNAGTGGATLSGLLAARLEAARVPEAAPEWLHVGLRAWLATRMAGTELPAPGHICGGAGAPTIAVLLDATKTPPARVRGQLARLVDVLVQRDVDLSAAIGKLGPGAVTDESFAAAFGVPAAEAQAFVFPASAASAACTDGTLPCTVCGGRGKLEIACPSCCGTGAVGCPSCFGTSECLASGCIRGYHYYETGDKERCGFCGGSGSVKCRACSGKGAMPCKQCRKGVTTMACTACDGGRIPCPDAAGGAALAKACGEVAGTPCPWCSTSNQQTYCEKCSGAGYVGCRRCFGTTRALCGGCGGSGVEIMVFSDGTKASSRKCDGCSGKGYTRCEVCEGGKRPCDCRGSGTQPMAPERCPMCEGTGKLADVATSVARRRERLFPPNAEDARAIQQAIERGVAFLMNCKTQGKFTLVETRGQRKGQLMVPSLYSNALCVWTLAAQGITREDPRMEAPFANLEQQAADLVRSGESTTTQTLAEALRALIGAGAAADDPNVVGLVGLLVKAQRRNGLWASLTDDEEEGSAFDGLFAVESLWVAQRRGVKVPRDTFAKAFRAASKLVGRSAFAKEEYLTGTEVCSAVALVVIAKAGSLGRDAATFDYRGMKEVQEGLAWLDRYMDIRQEPRISRGAYVHGDSASGYAAYLYAIQRLSMLLSIEVLGGERWYATGARHLVATQQKDGSWIEGTDNPLNGPVRTTTSALLFLARATPAVTDPGEEEK